MATYVEWLWHAVAEQVHAHLWGYILAKRIQY